MQFLGRQSAAAARLTWLFWTEDREKRLGKQPVMPVLIAAINGFFALGQFSWMAVRLPLQPETKGKPRLA